MEKQWYTTLFLKYQKIINFFLYMKITKSMQLQQGNQINITIAMYQ